MKVRKSWDLERLLVLFSPLLTGITFLVLHSLTSQGRGHVAYRAVSFHAQQANGDATLPLLAAQESLSDVSAIIESGTGCDIEFLSESMPPGSPALGKYLTGVYGVVPLMLLNTWNWSQVDVVWRKHVPFEVQKACAAVRWSPVRGHLFWTGYDYDNKMFRVYQYDDAPCSWRANDGGPGLPLYVVEGGWMEVQHSYIPHGSLEATGYWTYRAVGSGVWYNAGKIMVIGDTMDLTRLLKVALRESCDHELYSMQFPPCRTVKHQEFTDAIPKWLVLSWLEVMLVDMGIYTYAFTHHADGGWKTDQPAFPDLSCYWTQRVKPYWPEIVSIRPERSTDCPELGPWLIQTGWGPPGLKPCRCTRDGPMFMECLHDQEVITSVDSGKYTSHSQLTEAQLSSPVLGRVEVVFGKGVRNCPAKLPNWMCNVSLRIQPVGAEGQAL